MARRWPTLWHRCCSGSFARSNSHHKHNNHHKRHSKRKRKCKSKDKRKSKSKSSAANKASIELIELQTTAIATTATAALLSSSKRGR